MDGRGCVMPILRGQIMRFGPMVEIKIGLSADAAAAEHEAGNGTNGRRTVLALLDTGSEYTMVDAKLVKDLGLRAIKNGQTVFYPASGSKQTEMNKFEASIALCEGATLKNVLVLESDLSGYGCQVVIGRDVLLNCVFHYDGNAARFSLSF